LSSYSAKAVGFVDVTVLCRRWVITPARSSANDRHFYAQPAVARSFSKGTVEVIVDIWCK